MIGEGDLERGIDSLRAGIGEEHVVEIAGQQRRDPGGELEGLGMAHLEGRRIVHLGGLTLDRRDDLGMAVPGVAAPQAGGAIEDAPPVGGGVMQPLGADEQARLRLELPVGGERHPVRLEVVGQTAGGFDGDRLGLGHEFILWRSGGRDSSSRIFTPSSRLLQHAVTRSQRVRRPVFGGRPGAFSGLFRRLNNRSFAVNSARQRAGLQQSSRAVQRSRVRLTPASMG